MLAALCALGASPAAQAAHAIAQYGAPGYAENFRHFGYVNPNAPKGGTLTLPTLARFDKFNPYSVRGIAAPGIGLLFESLAVNSLDEVASMYGLLADDIRVARDGMSVTFHLNPRARFSNGDAVRAADVKFSFDTLKSPQAAPWMSSYLGGIARVVVVDAQTVRFEFHQRSRELPLIAGSMPVFSHRWGLRADGTRIAFDQLAFEQPIGSGPYTIERYANGRTITYRRNPHYWGANLPVRVGMNNFDHITYKFYADDTARIEAFKAGEYDVLVENVARNWVRRDIGKKFDSGELAKRTFAHHNITGMQGFVLNLRRPMFRDVRVRHALDLALDFQWMNRQLFYSQYRRTDSFFANTEWQARGLPSPGELKLLNPWRAQLGAAVFGPMPAQPDTDPPGSLRANLLAARALLAQAGWTYRNGALRDAKGQPLTFDVLVDTSAAATWAPIFAAYQRALARLGIQMNYRPVDAALYQQRIEAFDFDVATTVYPVNQVPGTEEQSNFDSRLADKPASNNLMGLKSPAVDAILHALVTARTHAQLADATHALDRVLMHGYYVVPQWYSDRHRIAFRSTLAWPATLPLYYSAEDWIVSTWWYKPPAH